MVSYAAPDATVPELHALATASPLRAKSLRFVLIDELMAHPTCTIAQLAVTLRPTATPCPGGRPR